MAVWSAGISLVGKQGPAGSNATLPKNIVGNSLTIAPVAGETQAVQIGLQTANGTQNFLVDATGNLRAVGNAVFGGTLSVTGDGTVGGQLNAARVRTGAGTAAAVAQGYAGEFRGAGTLYTSGLFFGSNFGDVMESVGGYQARSAAYLNGAPRDMGPGYVTHVFRTSIANTGVDAYRFQVADSNIALRIAGNGVATLAGLFTTAGVTLSSGAITFADGTTLATAPAATAAPTTFAATQPGTAASPAFRYTGATNGAGLFFDGALGNASIAVNGFASLTSTAQSGAAAGASGWAVRSTLGAGAQALAVFGAASTTTPVWAVDGAGSVTSGALTLSGAITAASARINGAAVVTGLTTSAGYKLSSGSLTFADGTSLSTAPAAGGGSAGPSTNFSATAPGSATTPAFNYQGANNGAGLYFDGAAGNVILSANGAKALFTQAASGAASGASGVGVASTLGAGSQVLGVYGQGVDSTVPANAQMTVDGAGAIKAAALNITSASGVTFADGTVQASAAQAAGPTVPTNGPFLLHNGGFAPGSYSGAGVALSATPVELGDGLGNPVTYIPPITSGLVAALFVCNSGSGTTTFELWDKTAGASIYKSAALGAGTLTNLPTSGSISQNTYPMIKGNVHVWRVTGTGTWQGHLTPTYWMQVAPPPALYGCNPYPMFTWRNLQTSATPQLATSPNNGNLMYYRAQKGTTFAFATLTNNATSGTVSFTLFDITNNAVKFTPIDNAGATLVLGPGQSVNTFVQNLALTAGTSYGWRITGTANGNFSATMWVVQ